MHDVKKARRWARHSPLGAGRRAKDSSRSDLGPSMPEVGAPESSGGYIKPARPLIPCKGPCSGGGGHLVGANPVRVSCQNRSACRLTPPSTPVGDRADPCRLTSLGIRIRIPETRPFRHGRW